MVQVVDVNFFEIVVSAVVIMIIGMIWYSKSLFGRVWMRSIGMSEKDIKKAKSNGMASSMIIAFVAALVMSFVLAHVVAYTDASNVIEGAVSGFWVWLGFIATTMINRVLWEKASWTSYLINAGYYLIALLVVGSMLVLW